MTNFPDQMTYYLRSFLLGSAAAVFASALPALADAPLAGLWHGAAEIGEVNRFGEDAVSPSAGVFSLPVLLHVDAGGSARLLKEAVILNDGADQKLLADPRGQRAMLEAMPAQTLQHARRLSVAGFGFADATVKMEGSFVPGAALTARIDLAPDDPANPFRHQYHPDHDNLEDGPTRQPLTDDDEVYRITRRIRISLPDTPEGADEDALSSLSGRRFARIIGIYEEAVEGLAAQPVGARGRLFLTRVSTVAELVE